jgi:hypothetical protein
MAKGLKKEKIQDDTSINWDSTDMTLGTPSISFHWFATKHSTGLCGVGKFLQIWKESDSVACTHELWKRQLKKL